MSTRLGLDLGTNSLGWCLYRLDEHDQPVAIEALGARIYGNGRNSKNIPLAEERRTARSMRRRRDRYLRRRKALISALIEYGLLPADSKNAKEIARRDPYELRVRALQEALDPFDIGRAIFHLNQRRGFQSNRKADRRRNDKDDGKVRLAEIELDRAMAESGHRTLGQFLHSRATKRVRLSEDGSGYEFYPQRRHYKQEFERIWQEQRKFHPALLTDAAYSHIRHIIFHQRDLKPQPVGRCTFLEEPRLPKAHPLFQERRLYEEVNQLRIRENGEERPLTLEQRDSIILALKQKRKISFEKLRKNVLKLGDDARFNKETEARKDLLGDEISAEMAHKSCFGNRWPSFDEKTRWSIIKHLIEDEDHADLTKWLQDEFDVNADAADAIADINIPEEYGRLGETASRAILAELKEEVIDYDEAVRRNGALLGHHSDRRPENGRSKLPYYGEILDRDLKPGSNDPTDAPEARFGRISNPTVHIGLNQLRRVVNEIIKAHGRPDEIVLEMARELKLNEKQREAANREIAKNTREAERRSKKLAENGIPDTGANRMLLRQWEELNPENSTDRYCPYCGTLGKAIGLRQLFHSSEVDIDHILPYSRTLDDSPANRILVHTTCNRQKGNLTPYEKWGHDPNRWSAIQEQVSRLHSSKQWRFLPDAMKKFEKENGFAERQLVDTQYLAVMAGKYLGSLYAKKEGRRVYVIPGKLTALLRRIWGLNSILGDHNIVANPHSNAPKNRLDHRHHVTDAAIAGITTHSTILKISTAAARAEHEHLERLFKYLPLPWPTFRDDLKKALDETTVSHRPDHGTISKAGAAKGKDQTAGRLHNETAYGITGEKDAKGKTIVVHRVPLTSLKKATDIEDVRDPVLRKALQDFTRGLDGKAFEEKLQTFPKLGHLSYRNIRRLRVVEPLDVIPIKDKNGRIYKGYKGDSNYRYDVWELKDGKWVAEVVSMFDAHQPGWTSPVRAKNPVARKVLSLHQSDLIAIEPSEGDRRLLRVVKFAQSGAITFAPPNEGGNLKARDSAADDPFKYVYLSAGSLKNNKARQVRVDELGRVADPGFPARKTRRLTRKPLAAE